jgi:hypothetical protein
MRECTLRRLPSAVSRWGLIPWVILSSRFIKCRVTGTGSGDIRRQEGCLDSALSIYRNRILIVNFALIAPTCIQLGVVDRKGDVTAWNGGDIIDWAGDGEIAFSSNRASGRRVGWASPTIVCIQIHPNHLVGRLKI